MESSNLSASQETSEHIFIKNGTTRGNPARIRQDQEVLPDTHEGSISNSFIHLITNINILILPGVFDTTLCYKVISYLFSFTNKLKYCTLNHKTFYDTSVGLEYILHGLY